MLSGSSSARCAAFSGFLAIAVTVLSSVALADTVIVPVTPPSFLAEKKEPKYLITMSNQVPEGEEISSGGVAEEEKGEVVMMTDKSGQRYACTLPNLDDDDEVPEEEDKAEGTSGDSATRSKSVSELLDSLGTACFFRVEGWWTYELCYHKHVRQYHSEREQTVSEYFLGHYDAEATREFLAKQAQSEYVEDIGGQGVSHRFHTHIYTNGTKCDLTGKGRETEVRFGCSSENTNNVLVSIKEPTTCRYVVVFYSPILCTHKAFKVQESPMEYINCRAVPAGESNTASSQGGMQGEVGGMVEGGLEDGDMSGGQSAGSCAHGADESGHIGEGEFTVDDASSNIQTEDEQNRLDAASSETQLKDLETLQALHQKLSNANHPASQQVKAALENAEEQLAARVEGSDLEGATPTEGSQDIPQQISGQDTDEMDETTFQEPEENSGQEDAMLADQAIENS